MDLAKLEKKAFIPTPGQYEQIYLAQNLKRRHCALCSEDEFTI
jgi:hypothetical protein